MIFFLHDFPTKDLSSVPNRKVDTVLLLRNTSFSVNQSSFSLASLTYLLENNWEDTGLSSHILRDTLGTGITFLK